MRVASRRASASMTEGALRATRVELAARLPDFRLSMRDISGLKVGSMLSTGIPIDSTINLLVGQQPRFKGLRAESAASSPCACSSRSALNLSRPPWKTSK